VGPKNAQTMLAASGRWDLLKFVHSQEWQWGYVRRIKHLRDSPVNRNPYCHSWR